MFPSNNDIVETLSYENLADLGFLNQFAKKIDKFCTIKREFFNLLLDDRNIEVVMTKEYYERFGEDVKPDVNDHGDLHCMMDEDKKGFIWLYNHDAYEEVIKGNEPYYSYQEHPNNDGGFGEILNNEELKHISHCRCDFCSRFYEIDLLYKCEEIDDEEGNITSYAYVNCYKEEKLGEEDESVWKSPSYYANNQSRTLLN